MPRFEVRRETTWDAAHYLRRYKGECENVHGHHWRVQVYVRANELDEQGMVVDFKDLERELLKVRERLDGTCLNDVEPFTRSEPSAENLALYVMKELGRSFDNGRTWVSKVMVWETEFSVASVESDRRH